MSTSPEASYRALPRRERLRLTRMVAVGAWSDDPAEAEVMAWVAARDLRRQPLSVALTVVAVALGVFIGAPIPDGRGSSTAFLVLFVTALLTLHLLFFRPRLRSALERNRAVARSEPLPPDSTAPSAAGAFAIVGAGLLSLTAVIVWSILSS